MHYNRCVYVCVRVVSLVNFNFFNRYTYRIYMCVCTCCKRLIQNQIATCDDDDDDDDGYRVQASNLFFVYMFFYRHRRRIDSMYMLRKTEKE